MMKCGNENNILMINRLYTILAAICVVLPILSNLAIIGKEYVSVSVKMNIVVNQYGSPGDQFSILCPGTSNLIDNSVPFIKYIPTQNILHIMNMHDFNGFTTFILFCLLQNMTNTVTYFEISYMN